MIKDPAYLQTISLHLSRVLDEIGLNEVTVKRRRRAYLLQEHILTTCMSLTGVDTSVYHFGSQTEGATIPGLNSDLDLLKCHHQYNAMQDLTEWQLGKVNLLMLHEDTAPGYCRLQLVRPDIPMACDRLVNDRYDVFDNSGRVILKNTLPLNYGPGSIRNGPANSQIGDPDFMDYDVVNAVKCWSWPRQAEEFISRHRRHNWPTQGVLQQTVKHGCFLVPEGHKLSPTEHLEWRISVSLAERCLMFSLNIVHIKVYVLLKMLVKSFVEPRARKCISSYHCKTALLYCTENTDSGFWVERNILQCVTRCLTLLLSWVTEEFCPHFIVKEINLFAGKVTALNRGKLQSILRDLVMSNGRVMLGLRIDGLGLKLQAHLNKEPSVIPVLDSPVTMLLIGRFEIDWHYPINDVFITFRKHAQNKTKTIVIHSVYTNIKLLKGRFRQADPPRRQAYKAILEFLYGWLGSMLASISLSHKMRVPRVAIQLLRTGAQYDVSVMLKLVSVLYSNGDYRKVETLLNEINKHFSSNIMQPTCRCYEKKQGWSAEFLHMLYALRVWKARGKLFAPCVVFSRQEIQCAPTALRNEFFRSVENDMQHRDVIKDAWMDLAVVDCLPYLHFLQYVTYRQLGKHDLQKQSLLNLERCIRRDTNFRHLETAWNLLGQCMEEEQEPEAAIGCYRTSLEIRPRNNAANWHVLHMCYSRIKNGVLPT